MRNGRICEHDSPDGDDDSTSHLERKGRHFVSRVLASSCLPHREFYIRMYGYICISIHTHRYLVYNLYCMYNVTAQY